ncbi:unnamed protein product [Moneuplotes crassus]|uniref:Uncharacterized protein n=1 Tax=Euplotes crassus TaxID=5936 RepID=A0AAD2D8P4_EUPCR|nr:unnamed protein product [Moneuplotes crassus]
MDNCAYALIHGYISLLEVIGNFQNSVEVSQGRSMTYDTASGAQVNTPTGFDSTSVLNLLFMAFLVGIILNYYLTGFLSGRRKAGSWGNPLTESTVSETNFNKHCRKDDDSDSSTF